MSVSGTDANRRGRAIRAIISASVGLAVGAVQLSAQQVADSAFAPEIVTPAYAAGEGPTVLVDAAHNNFHTADGRYYPFAHLLRRDGYVVSGLPEKLDSATLAEADILVISNAIADENAQSWSLPHPVAFTDEEVAALDAWVQAGGSLLLIADHWPMPASAENVARAFGLIFNDGYALERGGSGPITFRRSDGTLLDHPIIEGRASAEAVDSVTSFVGQAFRPRPGAPVVPLLTMRDSAYLVFPDSAGQISPASARVRAEGWLQGATVVHGRGRVAAFGEAAMFTAQVAGPGRAPLGMNVPTAAQNPAFLLNVMHWLSGLLPVR